MKHYALYDRDLGCQQHRMLWPARHLRHDFPQHWFHAATTDPEFDYDVMFSNGLLHPRMIDCFARWKSKGKVVVWGADDDYRSVPKWSPCYLTEDQLGTWYLARELADVILVSTDHLAATFDRPQKIVVARNLLDLNYYSATTEPADETDGLVIAWSGSKTHAGDLAPLVPVVTHCLQKFRGRVEFVFCGYCHPEILRDHLHNGVVWQEGVPLSLYTKVLSAIRPHVWLSPLDDCNFNRSKSNIRCLEGWAISAAVVASPVGEYSIVRDGVDGLTASSTDEWIAALEKLITDRDYSRKLAVAGRKRVEEIGDWRNPECRKSSGWVDYVHRLEEMVGSSVIAA